MANEMMIRLTSRRWLVDTARFLAPPQHFMTNCEPMTLDDAIAALSECAPLNPIHLYIHVPFCEEHCTFCKYFNQGATEGGHLVRDYVNWLAHEIDKVDKRLAARRISAVYVGGGTASILTVSQIKELFSGLQYRLADEIDATFEMSPRSTTFEKLQVLRGLGFNRISFGLQTFSETLSHSMRRRPATVQRMGELLECTRSLGFRSTNVDLMVGVENESSSDVYDSAMKLFALRPPSVSLYCEARPNPSRADVSEGFARYVSEVVQPRILSIIDLARSCDYYTPGKLTIEQTRFLDKRWKWQARPPECRYRTRFDPSFATTLIGLGPRTFSFCGGQIYAVTPSLPPHRFTSPSIARVYRPSTVQLGAAVVVNLLFRGRRTIEHDVFRRLVGASVGDLFGAEMEFLKARQMVEDSEGVIRRTSSDELQWAYAEKLFYPEEWIQQLKMPELLNLS